MCEGGMSPSEAVALLLSRREDNALDEDTSVDQGEAEQGSAQRALQRILDATRRFDHSGLERAVREATLIGSARRVFEEIFAPALREIGDEWHQGSLSIAQEHMATELIESATRDMLRVVQPDEGPSILLACVQEEVHVLPLYGSAFYFTQWGYRVTLLGANTPPQALADTVKALKPHAIGLSITQQQPQLLELLPKYAEACGACPWVTGGMGANYYQAEIERLGGRVVTSDLLSLRLYLDSFPKQLS